MKVLGIIFGNRLEWASQVEKSIAAARQVTQFLGLVWNFFNAKKMSKLVIAVVFSRLYYAAQVWLHPQLKKD